jgi:molybdate transport system substrate-binding protein
VRRRFGAAHLIGLVLAATLVLAAIPAVRAETVSVAVAANFTDATRVLAKAFKAQTGDDLVPSFGATGSLYAQISQGAPFEVFLAADSATPARAVAEGFGVKGSIFTYAVGRVVLFSADPQRVTGAATLTEGRFDRIAIANPRTAPYGAAAVAVMRKLGVYAALAPKFVTGTNISQAYQFVDTGNAELGFVALSQIASRKGGSRWLVPQADYPPITQDAVLLNPGRDSPGARAFLDFLRSPEAVKIIESFGYGIGE